MKTESLIKNISINSQSLTKNSSNLDHFHINYIKKCEKTHTITLM